MDTITRIRPLVFLFPALLFLAPVSLRAEEVIELLDGTKIRGDIRSVQASKIVLVSRPEGTRIEIPLTYLSPLQQYKARKWRLKPDDLSPTDPNIRMQLAKWCFEHSGWNENLKEGWDERLKEIARAEFEKAVELGGDEFKAQVEAYLEDNNIKIDKDGKWISADKWHEEQGHVRDPETGKWITQEEYDKREAQLLKELKIKRYVQNPNDYTRVFLPVLDANRRRYMGKDKTDNLRKIRFWGHFLLKDEEFKQAKAWDVSTVTNDRYIRFLVSDADCSDLYVEKKKHKGKIAKKLDLFRPGDRVLIFGRVFITEKGFLILVEDVIAR